MRSYYSNYYGVTSTDHGELLVFVYPQNTHRISMSNSYQPLCFRDISMYIYPLLTIIFSFEDQVEQSLVILGSRAIHAFGFPGLSLLTHLIYREFLFLNPSLSSDEWER
jgi:hypothetical protein